MVCVCVSHFTIKTILIKIPHHPRANYKRYVREHILVFEKAHNCSILKLAVIHHVNGIKDDSCPENLQGMAHGQQNRHLICCSL